MNYSLREKFAAFPFTALAIVLAGHVLFFTTISLQMPILTTTPKTEIAFLGAILDSFEVQKVGATPILTPDVSAILAKPDPSAGTAVTATSKPYFTKEVNVKPKHFTKDLPTSEKKGTPIFPPREIKRLPEPPEQQPYQRLRLYQ